QIALIGNARVFNPAAANRIGRGLTVLSEVLCERYPASHEAIVYDASTHPIEPPRIIRHRLAELGRAPGAGVSTPYIPPVAQAQVDTEMWARLAIDNDATAAHSREIAV